jgi:hypothetical protein
LLLAFIGYDMSQLIILQNECAINMIKWLVAVHILILVMKSMLTLIDNLDEETECSVSATKIIACIFYILVYPFLIIWNILGTFWFLSIEDKVGTDCVHLLL